MELCHQSSKLTAYFDRPQTPTFSFAAGWDGGHGCEPDSGGHEAPWPLEASALQAGSKVSVAVRGQNCFCTSILEQARVGPQL